MTYQVHIGSIVQAKLISTDEAYVYCKVTPPSHQLRNIMVSHAKQIREATGTAFELGDLPAGKSATATSTSNVKDAQLEVSSFY